VLQHFLTWYTADIFKRYTLTVHIIQWKLRRHSTSCTYVGWNFNSGNYLFTTDTK